jgi:hypothetical protein
MQVAMDDWQGMQVGEGGRKLPPNRKHFPDV